MESEQFGDLKKGIMNLENKMSLLERDITSLKEKTTSEINLVKYGLGLLVALGLFKSCGNDIDYHRPVAQQIAPPAQIYVISAQEKKDNYEERIKAVEQAYQILKEAKEQKK